MDSLQNSSTGSFVGDNGVVNTQQPNDTAIDEEKQNLNDVINSIQKTLGLLHQLHLTVSNSLVLELGNMVKSSEKCNIQVPIEVLNLIDDGKNPDDFTKEVFNSCVVKNQMTKGKTDQFKALRKHLLEELEQSFPEQVDIYREIRASAAAEAKRLSQTQSMLPNGDVKVKPEI
ncbi:hypothetical protein ACFE04_005713 [Oxalis oulophora]